MIEIKELIFDDGYVLNTDSYCRKSIFMAKENKTGKEFKVKTFISVLDDGGDGMVDAFTDHFYNGCWNNITDIIPVIPEGDNIRDIQDKILTDSLSVLFEKNVSITDIDNYEQLNMSNWETFYKNTKEDNNLNVIAFSDKET